MPWGLPGRYLNSTSITRQLGICTDFLIHLGNWTPVGLDQGYQEAPESGGGVVQRLLTCCVFSVRTLSLSGLQRSRSCWTLVPALSRIQRGKQRRKRGAQPPDAGVPRGLVGGGESASGPALRAARDRRWRRRGGRGGISHQPAAAGALRSARAAVLAGSAPRPRPPGKRVPARGPRQPRFPEPPPGRPLGLRVVAPADLLRPRRRSRKPSECGAPPSWARGHPSCALPPTLGNFWEVPCLPRFLPEVA